MATTRREPGTTRDVKRHPGDRGGDRRSGRARRDRLRLASRRIAHTGMGQVRASHVILATEGYTANLPGRHRSLLPLNSAMIVTEPLSEKLWAGLRWEGAETLLDGSHLYTYSQRAADGRIAIG